MFKRLNLMVSLILFFCLLTLIGCQTTKGIIEGIPKDIRDTYKALSKIDNWLRENLW
ncbi:MAG: hypothetical protein NC912_02070 [Candidatus Omnitrophica bacterium]|nr:hypothetical protein [Candidatus Omnitrophota bacterium]